MRTTFAILVFLFQCVAGADAQILIPEKMAPDRVAHSGEQGPGVPAFVPSGILAEKMVVLSYHDTSQVRLVWRVPSNYGGFTSYNLAQRFTLPAESGILDSVAVLISELPLGEIKLESWGDTLLKRFPEDTVLFHFPNYFRTPLIGIDTARLAGKDRNTTGFTMIHFNGKQVPKEFHVSITPTTTGGISSYYGLISDSRFGDDSTITPEIARTSMIIQSSQGVGPIIMHGAFQIGGRPIAQFFYMFAFVTLDGSTSVIPAPGSSAFTLLPGYPNPAGERSDVSIPFFLNQGGHVRLEVFDLLGRRVAFLLDSPLSQGPHLHTFRAQELGKGVFISRLSTAAGSRSGRLIIR